MALNAELKEKYRDISYWQALLPGLSMTNDRGIERPARFSLDDQEWEKQSAVLKHDGYFQYPQLISDPVSDQLADAVSTLQLANIPVVFTFLFDEFWALLLDVAPILERVLGPDYLILPNVWTWYVTADHDTGFSPHRDSFEPHFVEKNGQPNILTIWIPLTDVTPLNSCISVYPGAWDPNYPDNIETVQIGSVQEVRALPGERGSIYGWTTGLLHWATRPSPLAGPRISVGYYVQSNRIKVYDHPVINFKDPLGFEKRLGLIGKQILTYSRDRSEDLIQFANTLQELL